MADRLTKRKTGRAGTPSGTYEEVPQREPGASPAKGLRSTGPATGGVLNGRRSPRPRSPHRKVSRPASVTRRRGSFRRRHVALVCRRTSSRTKQEVLIQLVAFAETWRGARRRPRSFEILPHGLVPPHRHHGSVSCAAFLVHMASCRRSVSLVASSVYAVLS